MEQFFGTSAFLKPTRSTVFVHLVNVVLKIIHEKTIRGNGYGPFTVTIVIGVHLFKGPPIVFTKTNNLRTLNLHVVVNDIEGRRHVARFLNLGAGVT